MILGKEEIIAALKAGEITHDGMPNPKEQPREFRDWCKKYVQPASLDFPIGRHLYVIPTYEQDPRSQLRFSPAGVEPIDTRGNSSDHYKLVDLREFPDGAVLGVHQFLLAHSEHVIGIGPGLAAQVSTRSTTKRWGLDVCGSAGWVDPGYCARITLEIKNDSPRPVRIRQGVCYGQIIFFRLAKEAEPYQGHYNVKEWKPECMLPKSL